MIYDQAITCDVVCSCVCLLIVWGIYVEECECKNDSLWNASFELMLSRCTVSKNRVNFASLDVVCYIHNVKCLSHVLFSIVYVFCLWSHCLFSRCDYQCMSIRVLNVCSYHLCLWNLILSIEVMLHLVVVCVGWKLWCVCWCGFWIFVVLYCVCWFSLLFLGQWMLLILICRIGLFCLVCCCLDGVACVSYVGAVCSLVHVPQYQYSHAPTLRTPCGKMLVWFSYK